MERLAARPVPKTLRGEEYLDQHHWDGLHAVCLGDKLRMADATSRANLAFTFFSLFWFMKDPQYLCSAFISVSQ